MRILLIVLALSSVIACGSDDDAHDRSTVDFTGVWPEATAESHGFDSAALEAAAAWVESQGSDSLLVVDNGAIIFERYWNGGDRERQIQTFSATKSYSSTLVGIAAHQGLLDIEDRASDYISEWVGTDSEDLPVRQLMTGDSGRFWDFPGDYPGSFGPPVDDLTQHAVDRGHQFEPGTTWQYNQMAMQCLDRVLSVVTGGSTVDYAREHLIEALGMTNTTVGAAGDQMTMAWGIAASARDMARLGYLYLNQGRWGDRQLLSPQYADAATRQANPINTGYGYMFWVNAEGGWLEAVTLVEHETGRPYPDAPLDVFVASGSFGQMIFTSPSENLIIVRQGHESPTGSGASARFYSEIYRRVVEARTAN